MTTPTTRLFLSRRAELLDWLRRSDPWHALSLFIVVAVLVGVWSTRPDTPPSEQQSTPAPVILVATMPTTPIPIAAPSPELRLLRAVVAYDAPDGKVLGAIEPGRRYQLVLRAWPRLAPGAARHAAANSIAQPCDPAIQTERPGLRDGQKDQR